MEYGRSPSGLHCGELPQETAVIWLAHIALTTFAAIQLSLGQPNVAQLTGDPASRENAAEHVAATDRQGAADETDPAVIALLDALEESHASLTGFTAKVRYDKESLVGRETRLGEVVFIADVHAGSTDTRASEHTSRRFAILFDTHIDGRHKRERLKHYIFDGRWLAEINHDDKQFIKREIVPPGEEVDPLKLGEGPFPMPIGQSRADVLTRFTARPASLPDSGPLAKLDPSTLDGLELTPRPGTPEAEDFTHVMIFYDRETRLPVGVITREPNGDGRVVRLTNVERNPEIDETMRRKVAIETPPADSWHIDIQSWK